VWPDISHPVSFSETMKTLNSCDLKCIAHEDVDVALSNLTNQETLKTDKTDKTFMVALLVGPEGGFSATEIMTAISHRFKPFGLGKRRLRSETAGVAAITLMMGVLGELGIVNRLEY